MTSEIAARDALPLSEEFIAGVDVGGTKVHIADTLSPRIHRFETPNYAGMNEVLDEYFHEVGARPTRICIGMAGPRDDETGSIHMTNSEWPRFYPTEASEAYGTQVKTANDMEVAVAGVVHAPTLDKKALKAGKATATGPKLVVTISTGVGAGVGFWDAKSQSHIIMPSEGGHIGFQPKDEGELDYLGYLHNKYPHASAELALSGMHGIDNLIDHSLEKLEHDDLADQLQTAREEGNPVGAVLLAQATEGNGKDRAASQAILGRMGAMTGSFLRDLAVTYRSTGGVYLIGSVALGLGEYFAEDTEFNDRFVRKGAVHEDWLEKVPVTLVTDPHVAVAGALALAKAM